MPNCLCGGPGKLRCSRCKFSKYCSAECQRADWIGAVAGGGCGHKSVCQDLKRVRELLEAPPEETSAEAPGRELLLVVRGLAEARIQSARLRLSPHASAELARGLELLLAAVHPIPPAQPLATPQPPPTATAEASCGGTSVPDVDPLEEFVWELVPACADVLCIQNWAQHTRLARLLLRLVLDRLCNLLSPKELLLALQPCLALPFIDSAGQPAARNPQLLGLALYRGMLARCGLAFVATQAEPPLAHPGWLRFPGGGRALGNLWTEVLLTHPRCLLPLYAGPLLEAIRSRFFALPLASPRPPEGRCVVQMGGKPPESALWSPVVWLDVTGGTNPPSPSPAQTPSVCRLFDLPTLRRAFLRSQGDGPACKEPSAPQGAAESDSERLVLELIRTGQLPPGVVEALFAHVGFLRSATDLALLAFQLHSGEPAEPDGRGFLGAELEALRGLVLSAGALGRHDRLQQQEVQRGVLCEASLWLAGLWAQLSLLVPQADLDRPQASGAGLEAARHLLEEAGAAAPSPLPAGADAKDRGAPVEPRVRECTLAPRALRQLVACVRQLQGGDEALWDFVLGRLAELDAQAMAAAAGSAELSPDFGAAVDSFLAVLLALLSELSAGARRALVASRPGFLESVLRLGGPRLRLGHPLAMYGGLRLLHLVLEEPPREPSPGSSPAMVTVAADTARGLLGFMQYWSEPWSRRQLAREALLRLLERVHPSELRLGVLVGLFRPAEEAQSLGSTTPAYLYHAGLVSVLVGATGTASAAWGSAVASAPAATPEESQEAETQAAEGIRLLAEFLPLLRKQVLEQPQFRTPTRQQAADGEAWEDAVARWRESGALDVISACTNFGLGLRRLAPALGGRGGSHALLDEWPRSLWGPMFRQLGESLRLLQAELKAAGGPVADPFFDLQLEMQLGSLRRLE